MTLVFFHGRKLPNCDHAIMVSVKKLEKRQRDRGAKAGWILGVGDSGLQGRILQSG